MVASFPAWLLRFANLLRSANVPVSTTEITDVVTGLTVIDLKNRTEVIDLLTSTLAKTPNQREILLNLLPAFWEGMESELDQTSAVLELKTQHQEQEIPLTLDELRQQIIEAIRTDAQEQFQDLARLTIANLNPEGSTNQPRGVSLYRTRQALQLRQTLQLTATPSVTLTPKQLTNYQQQLRSIERFEATLRRQLQREYGDNLERVEARSLAAIGRQRSLFEVHDPHEVRRAVYALRRALRTVGNSQQQRGKRHQQIDIRRTVRHSLATGGVPINPVLRHRRPKRPKLFVLCDVSTSVANASSFFLSVLQGIHELLPKTRCFAFVERVAEITALMREQLEPKALSRKIDHEAHVVDHSGYTDYGRVWSEFSDLITNEIDARSTIIILGDARTNGRDPGVTDFIDLTQQVKRTVWINPEPTSYWSLGDSVASSYTPHCSMVECWNPTQLATVVRKFV